MHGQNQIKSAEEIWSVRSKFYLAVLQFILDSVWPFKFHWLYIYFPIQH